MTDTEYQGPLTELEVTLLQWQLQGARKLIAELEAVRPWHPIHDPPPDRSRVLMTNKSNSVWVVKSYESRDGFCATHWMEIPPLPVQEGSS